MEIRKGGGNMFDDVRRYLSDTIDAFATKRYDDLQQIAEFAPAAKARI
jgi:phosphate uptake regulator